MKKIISIISISLLSLSLSACGGEPASGNNVSLIEETNASAQAEDAENSAQIEDEQTEMSDDSARTEDEQTEGTDDSVQTEDEQIEETDDSAQTEIIQIEETESEKTERILVDLCKDLDDTRLYLLDELDNVYIELGYTYESYMENKAVLFDWYDLVQSKSDQLRDTWVSKSKAYFESAATYTAPGDDDAWKEVCSLYLNTVSKALDNLGMEVYKDAFDDVHAKYSSRIYSGTGDNDSVLAAWSDFDNKGTEVKDHYIEVFEASIYEMGDFIMALMEIDVDISDCYEVFVY